MEEGLLKQTGKAFEFWIDIVTKSGLLKHSEIVKFLKTEHGFTHGYANFVSLKAREADAGSIDNETLVNDQYKGKEQLKPVYDKLISLIKKFGDDIEIIPKKDSVSLKRKHQFALIKPATKSRIDLGLKLKGIEPDGRLENSGPFGTMCTHRIRIEKEEDIDQELIHWLKESYNKSV